MAVIRDKVEYHRQTHERMDRHFVVPEWSARQKLALAGRILAAEGHDSGIAGQLSARAERPGTYYMLRFGLGLEEATPENLLVVDDDLHVLEGEGMPNPSNRFHLWITRPPRRNNDLTNPAPAPPSSTLRNTPASTGRDLRAEGFRRGVRVRRRGSG
jgi:L-fuculose-phosphate aldolase